MPRCHSLYNIYFWQIYYNHGLKTNSKGAHLWNWCQTFAIKRDFCGVAWQLISVHILRCCYMKSDGVIYTTRDQKRANKTVASRLQILPAEWLRTMCIHTAYWEPPLRRRCKISCKRWSFLCKFSGWSPSWCTLALYIIYIYLFFGDHQFNQDIYITKI